MCVTPLPIGSDIHSMCYTRALPRTAQRDALPAYTNDTPTGKGRFALGLSEEEQQLLEQMERSLHEADPDFASLMGGAATSAPRSKRKAGLGVVILLAGLASMLAGVIVPSPPLGIMGFVAMLLGSIVLYRTFTSTSPDVWDGSVGGAAVSTPKRRTYGGMRKLEDRWDRRQQRREEEGF